MIKATSNLISFIADSWRQTFGSHADRLLSLVLLQKGAKFGNGNGFSILLNGKRE